MLNVRDMLTFTMPGRTSLVDDFVMAFLSMGRGHSRLVPLGIETILIPDSRI